MSRAMARRADDTLIYDNEPDLAVDAFIDVLRRSTLAERRPVGDHGRIARMLAHADIVLCARNGGGLLVGVSRADRLRVLLLPLRPRRGSRLAGKGNRPRAHSPHARDRRAAIDAAADQRARRAALLSTYRHEQERERFHHSASKLRDFRCACRSTRSMP